MKKIKFFSLILALILVFNITVPIACAASATNGATAQMNAPVTDGNYTMSGAETSDVRFNLLINNTNQTGQPAPTNILHKYFFICSIYNLSISKK